MGEVIKLRILGILNKLEKTYKVILSSFLISSVMISSAYAGTPKLITGTVNLFQTITKWLLLIIPVGAGSVLGYQALQRSLMDENGLISEKVGEKNRMMKNVIIGAAIAETASGFINVILSFYQ